MDVSGDAQSLRENRDSSIEPYRVDRRAYCLSPGSRAPVVEPVDVFEGGVFDLVALEIDDFVTNPTIQGLADPIGANSGSKTG